MQPTVLVDRTASYAPARATSRASRSRKRSVTLWIVQGLLAGLFLFAGGMKLVVSIETLAKQSPLPGFFLQFIGVVEVLGAFGLILPAALRIRPSLTPLAASGLVIVMIGATTVTIATGPAAGAVVPFVVGLLAAFIAYNRWRVVPVQARSRRESPRRAPHRAAPARAA